MLIDMSDELIPLKRPHFELRQQQLYFMLSSRPCADLDAADEVLWDGIDGLTTVGQLCHLCPTAPERLQRFWELGFCEMVPPRFRESRRRVLVFEPHMDDAALSVGGLMWARRDECEFTLVSIAGYSNFTSYYFLGREYFDVARITALRKAESELVMRLLGGRHSMLEECDAPLRYQPGNWSLAWYRANRRCVNARIGHCSPESEISSWSAAIGRVLHASDAQEIWLPLGVGGHTDHELARNACLQALGRNGELAGGRSLFFYQDVPYATQFPGHTSQILDAISAAGGSLVRQSEDISKSLVAKLRLNSIYGSQFKLSFMAPKIEEAARGASISGDGCCEVLFRVDKLPRSIAPLAMYSGRAVVEKLVLQLAGWYRRHRLAKRIRILSLVGVGCWAEDMQFLLDAFPRANFEVYLSDATYGEAERLLSPRISVHSVKGRARAWLWLLLRTALSRPCPLMVMTGESRQQMMPLIGALCVLSDPFAAITTNHLVQALRVVDAGALIERQ